MLQLREQQPITFLDSYPVPRVLVVGREPCGMCGFCDFSCSDFLEGVDPFAISVEGVHEMHGDGFAGCFLSED